MVTYRRLFTAAACHGIYQTVSKIGLHLAGFDMHTSSNSSASPTVRRRDARAGECPLCRRTTTLTFHHLIPKKMHRRNFFQKTYKRQQLATGIYICRQCHNGIHLLFDEMTLAKRFNTLENLLMDETLQKHFRWVARQRLANSLNEKVRRFPL
jgi:5-methylcytosine-specific restriction endonuclease McrA